jgi:hypothetical protein
MKIVHNYLDQYKSLLYGKLSIHEFRIAILALDDHVRERHDPHDCAGRLGIAMNLKEIPDTIH